MSKKPDISSSIYVEMLQDIQQEMSSVGEIREANRNSPYREHLAMVAEGVGTLAWINIDKKPAEYASEVFGGAQLYGNRVLKEYKEKLEVGREQRETSC